MLGPIDIRWRENPRHYRDSGNPVRSQRWIPAFAGMTEKGAGTPMTAILLALLALAAVNVWTMLRFLDDKRRAVAGRRRIPEADLLGLAFLGGSPGALLARRLLRHKTRKQPFSTYLWLIAMVQAGLVLGFLIA
jgi:uncharacterized membrane protein YsdA (DUF1294 family)